MRRGGVGVGVDEMVGGAGRGINMMRNGRRGGDGGVRSDGIW